MTSLVGDIRYGVRMLLRAPGFTAVAILSLALAIGANTAVFSLLNALFLRPLPVERPAELVSLFTLDGKNAGYFACSYPNYLDIRDGNDVFSGLTFYLTIPLRLAAEGEPQPLTGQIVAGNYFQVLGVQPVIGRGFLPEEDRAPGERAVAVISHGLWVRQFSSNPAITGKTIQLNGRAFTVVGVAPTDFRGVNQLVTADVWVPAMTYPAVLPQAGWFHMRRALLFLPIGRLKGGVSQEAAQASMQPLARQLERRYPADNAGRSLALMPLAQAAIHPNQRGDFVLAGSVLMAMAALVLLIACANLASLLVARGAARRGEIAVRLALGAGRGRLARQFLTEGLLLALGGAVAGLAVAWWARAALWSLRPPLLAATESQLTLDGRVLAFAALAALASGLLFGLAPMFEVTRGDLSEKLKEGGAGGRRWNPRRVLVTAQVAFSVVALVSAALFLRSLHFAQRIDPGFETRRLAVLSFNLGAAGYSEARGREFQREVRERARRVPGVTAAALASVYPFGAMTARTVAPDDRVQQDTGPLTLFMAVDPDYFRATGVRLLQGRNFGPHDGPSGPRVAIVNQAMARQYWPAGRAVGKRFRFFGESAAVEVVGVASDANYIALGEKPRALIYVPLEQNYTAVNTLYLRTTGDPAAALGGVRRELHGLDARLAVSNARTMPEILHAALWAPRTGAGLLSLFGVLASALAAMGLYAVVTHSVQQRRREIGIRMAIGAGRAHVIRGVLAEGMALTGAGVALGLAAALGASRTVGSLLFGIGAGDPVAFLAAPLALAVIALLACWLPARRAARVNPASALRVE